MRYLLGLTASLSLTLSAFEWKSYENEVVTTLTCGYEQIIDIPDNYCLPPPPPILVQPEIIETFDEEATEDILLDLISEFTPNQSISPRIDFANYLSNDSSEGKEELKEYLIYCEFGKYGWYEEPNLTTIRQIESESEEEQTDEPFMVVEEPAAPEDGFEAFYKYLVRHIIISKQAKYYGVDFKVYVQFIIERDGSLTDFKIIKGDNVIFNEEVLRVLKQTPKWNAGKQRGIPVRQRMIIPIIIKVS